MFLPLTSDAELKHWPFATGGFIVLHLLIILAQAGTPSEQVMVEAMRLDGTGEVQTYVDEIPGWYDLMLSHGDGLHPMQWLTSMLIHDGFGHFLGNMIFLWVFGHIVEGITGPWLFSGLYLGLGILQNAVMQILFLGIPAPPSLGASGAIYSIMMVAVFLSPQDNVQCWLFVFLQSMIVNIPVLIMGLFYFLWDLGIALLYGFTLSTELLHVAGAVFGLGAGIVLLGAVKVDCDGRDLFSMMRGRSETPGGADNRAKPTVERHEPSAEEQQTRMRKLEFAWKSFDACLDGGHPETAILQLQTIRKLDPKYSWNEDRLLRLLKLLQQQKRYTDVLRYSDVYLQSFESRAAWIRLNMARINALAQGLPRKALRILQDVDLSRLDPHSRQLAVQLQSHCQRAIADGALELSDE